MHILTLVAAIHESKDKLTETPIVDDPYQKYLSDAAKSRHPSFIRELQKYLDDPEVISFGGGLPNTCTFPFKEAEFTLKDGAKISVPEEQMKQALQYGSSFGDKNLIDILHGIQLSEHKPSYQPSILAGIGSLDLIDKVFDLLLNPGDAVMIETPTYIGTIQALRGRQLVSVEVEMDGQGSNVEKMEQILGNWPVHKTKPKLFYTIPSGHNPTGINTTIERKKAIYDLAKKHDFFILEDDPYYFLQFDERTPSYLSIDCDNIHRVIRLDSFSKIFAPGLRVGFATGAPELINKMMVHQMATGQHPCRLAQRLIVNWVEQIGFDGFFKHVKDVSDFYKSRRDVFLKHLLHHLPSATWTTPQAGMFVWVQLHSEVKATGKEVPVDSMKLVKNGAIGAKVLIVPGSEFYPRHRKSSHVRMSFSVTSEEQMDEGLQRLAQVVADWNPLENNSISSSRRSSEDEAINSP